MHFGKFPRLPPCIAAKCPRKSTAITEKGVFNKAVAMLTLRGSVNFPFCYGIYYRNVIIMEFIGGTETTEYVANLSIAKINGFTISRLKFLFQKIFEVTVHRHGKYILHNDLKSDNVIVNENRVVIIDFGKPKCCNDPCL